MFKLKIKPIIAIISLGTTICTPTLFLTSCGGDDRKTGTDYSSPYANFINERTFSIMSVNSSGNPQHFGTGWIFKKSTTAIDNYVYYLATNVHVAADFSFSGEQMWLSYNPDYTNQKYIPVPLDWTEEWYQIPTYTLLGKDTPVNHSQGERPWLAQNATHPDPMDSGETIEYECDVDFDVFKIDFGVSSDIQNNDPYKAGGVSPLKTRLDALNTYAAQNQSAITEFETHSSFNYFDYSQRCHVAGFPARDGDDQERPKWQSYITYIQTVYNGQDADHPFTYGTPSYSNVSFSDGVYTSGLGTAIEYIPYSTPTLTGGSSGSMVIDDDYKVIAINFAGRTNELNIATSSLAMLLDANSEGLAPNQLYRYNVWNWFTNLT